MTAQRPLLPLSALRSRGAFAFVFALLAAAALVPVWRVRLLPLLDEPNHLSAAFIMHHWQDPWACLKEFYELNIVFVPYMTYYFLVDTIAYASGIEVANKLLLSTYILSIPSAALWWTRRTRRSPWLSLLTFPLGYSFAWACGFHPYNLGVSVFLFTVAVLDSFLERPRRRSAGALLALGMVCDLTHPLAVLALWATVPVLLIAHRARFRRAASALGLLAPGVALLAWQILQSKLSWLRPTKGGPFYHGLPVDFAWTLKNIPIFVMGSVSGELCIVVFWVLVAVASLLVLIGPETRSLGFQEREERRALLFKHRSAGVAAVMLALCFLLPFEIDRPFDWWFVGPRFASLAFFFGFLVPTGEIRGVRAVVLAPALAACLWLPHHISEKYADFNARAAPFVRMVEQAAPGTHILLLCMGSRGDRSVRVQAYNQLAAWVQILHGGYSSAGWFDVGYPFRVKKHLPAPLFTAPETFDAAKHAGPYSYIIVRNEERPILASRPDEWRVAAAEGEWVMYERMGLKKTESE